MNCLLFRVYFQPADYTLESADPAFFRPLAQQQHLFVFPEGLPRNLDQTGDSEDMPLELGGSHWPLAGSSDDPVTSLDAPSAPFTNASRRECDDCNRQAQMLFWCDVCAMTFCLECWGRCPPHRTGNLGPGGVPHEKTDHQTAETIRSALRINRTNQEQEELHQSDQDTAWFGVARDAFDEPTFQDYGRYAALMTESTKTRHESRYPSLVSFVGTTGEGGSSQNSIFQSLKLYQQGRAKVP